MPTYVYRREDGSTFEIEQRITEPALETCPSTGQKVKRVISGAGLIFKGSGFYLTDYARNGNGKAKKSAESGEGGSTEAKKTEPSAKSEKSETKSASTTEKKD